MLSGMYLVISAVTFLLLVGALVDVITRDDSQVKYMPKIVWVLLIVFLPLIGSVLWLLVGREYSRPSAGRTLLPVRAKASRASVPTEVASRPGGRPLSTEEQLTALEREIEFHEKQQRIERLQREIEDRRSGE
jgi:hypothetical protein